MKLTVFIKRRLLSQTFLLLRQKVAGVYVVTTERWKALMKALHPDMSPVQVDLLNYVLDENGSGTIGR